MNAGRLGRELSAISGRPCTHAYLLQNRRHVALGALGALACGVAIGFVISQWLLASIVMLGVVGASSRFNDRRIVAIDGTGIVQAKSAEYRATPVAMLPPLRYDEVEIRGPSKLGDALFRLDGRTFIGVRGTAPFAHQLRQYQLSSSTPPSVDG